MERNGISRFSARVLVTFYSSPLSFKSHLYIDDLRILISSLFSLFSAQELNNQLSAWHLHLIFFLRNFKHNMTKTKAFIFLSIPPIFWLSVSHFLKWHIHLFFHLHKLETWGPFLTSSSCEFLSSIYSTSNTVDLWTVQGLRAPTPSSWKSVCNFWLLQNLTTNSLLLTGMPIAWS